jgi:Lar family restriction alleviation protein
MKNKPCPFCGCTNLHEGFSSAHQYYIISCICCGCKAPAAYLKDEFSSRYNTTDKETLEEAYIKWNTRSIT